MSTDISNMISHIELSESDNDFIGVISDGDRTYVRFPRGFYPNSGNLSEHVGTAADIRHSITLLLRIIDHCSDRGNQELSLLGRKKDRDDRMPVNAYIYLIRDFMTRGYYHETEVIYKNGHHGKINWAKTVKNVRPMLQDDEAYYLDFIVRKNRINEDNLVTLIHKYCIYLSFKRMGWLYTDHIPDSPIKKIDEDTEKVFHNVIARRISETFNDRNRLLFKGMLDIIDNSTDADDEQRFGISNFNTVWQEMIERVYGNEDRKKYYPRGAYHIGSITKDDLSQLEPDSIMKYDDDIYVLDAKYYGYGSDKYGTLPNITSIAKQIIYGENAEMLVKGLKSQVYNAFVLPFNAADSDGRKIINIGYADTGWRDGTKKYEKIQVILLDTRYLMELTEDTNRTDPVMWELAKAIKY